MSKYELQIRKKGMSIRRDKDIRTNETGSSEDKNNTFSRVLRRT